MDKELERLLTEVNHTWVRCGLASEVLLLTEEELATGRKTYQQLEEQVTYYNVRQFLTLLYRQTHNEALKTNLKELLKILAKLEIKNMPVPTIKKLKDISPAIF